VKPLTRPEGMIDPGNIDLKARPVVHNGDGGLSTVRSISVELDGQEVLLPTITPDGTVLSRDEAVKLYRDTGQHLGIFDSAKAANKYAKVLHAHQERLYGSAKR
jgi:hypothetical protein